MENETTTEIVPANNNHQPTSEHPLHIQDSSYYSNARQYWSTVAPTVEGMLGGFGSISFIDIRGSEQFLKVLFNKKPAPGRHIALDCGAGIGRVSRNLLMPLFERVDLVEQDGQFCETAKKELGGDAVSGSKLGTVFNVGLQEFTPQEGRYDVIWAQWVLGHLTDDDAVDFFTRCARGLTSSGMMVIKENFTSGSAIDFDAQDSSVTRPLKLMKQLLARGNMRVVKEQRQLSLPKELYPVYMLALRPIVNKS